jgi:hypothetical protein
MSGEVFNLDDLLETIINKPADYSNRHEAVKQTVKLRESKKRKLENGLVLKLFYAAKGDAARNQTLFYDFVYGYEKKLSGTGLREAQFKQAFLHPSFKEAIEFMYAQIINMPAWNLNEPMILKGFLSLQDQLIEESEVL